MELQTECYELLTDKKLLLNQELVMVDVDSTMPINIEYHISHMFVMLCEQGCAKFEYDFNPMEIHTHDVCVGVPGHIYKMHELSDDYKARIIILSEDFTNKTKHLNIAHYNNFSGFNAEKPVGHLTDEQYDQMCNAFNLLQTVSSMGTIWRENMMLNVFHTIIMMRHEFCPIPEESKKKTELRISARFQEAVVKHYRESHEVDFYARLFGFSPKYFAALIKSELKVSPRQWINRYLTMQAKSMLVKRNDLNIQQIAYLLGFKDQTTFCRFFKKIEGISPTSYRKKSKGK